MATYEIEMYGYDDVLNEIAEDAWDAAIEEGIMRGMSDKELAEFAQEAIDRAVDEYLQNEHRDTAGS